MSRPSPDPVAVLCALADVDAAAFGAAALRARYGSAIDFLLRMGALVPGDIATTISCGACFEDHSADVEFDADTRTYHHFCPEAGRVALGPRDLETLRVDINWLLAWLEESSPIVLPRRRELVAGRAWQLGETIVGKTELSVVLARGASGPVVFDALAAALETVATAELHLVLTTTLSRPRRLALPHGHVFLDLPEIMRVAESTLVLDRKMLGAWVKGFKRRSSRPIQVGPGRPTERHLVLSLRRELQATGVSFESKTGEARAIQDLFEKQHSDRKVPALTTILTLVRNSAP